MSRSSPALRSRRAPRAVALCLAAGAASCSEPAAPVWIHLAEGFQPSPVALDRSWSGSPWVLRPAEEGIDVWIEREVASSLWRSVDEHPRLREIPFPFDLADEGDGGSVRLEVGPRVFEHDESPATVVDPSLLEAGRFTITGGRLVAALGSTAPPREAATVAVRLDRGRPREGRWSFALLPHSGDGFPLLPGSTETIERKVPGRSALRFATLTRSVESGGAGARTEHGPVTFRVLLDGVEILRHEQAVRSSVAREHHVVELPERDASRSSVTFEATGPPALAAIQSPVIGPRSVGGFDARPWGEGRRNLVLFVADTFRADLMAAYGGDPSYTPELDALARESAVFVESWSASTWTLPSHATLFSGLHPLEHQAVDQDRGLSAEFLTVAELLSRHGYRTVGISEGGFVGHGHGLAQGFETFDEAHGSLDQLVARVRAALAEDDGRPLFLFLQTYRAHGPYVVTQETRRELDLGEELDGGYAELRARIARSIDGDRRGDPSDASFHAACTGLHGLYRGGAADLDRGVGRVLRELRRRRLLPAGALLFTSDHGEAFGEHGYVFHGNAGTYDEVTRVPLLLHGAGIAPGRIDDAAATIDVPRTIAALASVPAPSAWRGRSLLEPARDAVAFAIDVRDADDLHVELALTDGDRKLVLEYRGDPSAPVRRAAFDLREDPGESSAIAPEDAAWIEPLLSRVDGELRASFEARTEPPSVSIRGREGERLRELGYLQDE